MRSTTPTLRCSVSSPSCQGERALVADAMDMMICRWVGFQRSMYLRFMEA
jgi:hypothetical protein